ncbi:baseplate multidomain protein megatron [Paragemmobacter straminiformis]|uniref:Glycoside hydrolase/phage tail family protein n=1 Tax=Paragemmobacter straminiformis TaxID=2045119 RepID=A0A842I9R8_9RHOB|nr:glycoside hydrolase/phage tail family protein [Gemmobacter straminiformis]MBC2835844.1 glycoside hydrolase/phage tail family protein [Gemmobacter straminiformis]
MATLVLAAAGSAFGSAVGGSVLGLTGAVIGRAVGATIGRAIDQRLLGAGAEPVQVGRMERLRLMGAGEGAVLPLVWGRVRIGGQVIWASGYTERRVKQGGTGKGTPQPETVEFSYSVSLAVALGEGVIRRIGRVWADGVEVDTGRLGMRFYRGTETQMPDPAIAAAKGADAAPAYRGTAYVVFEDLPLGEFGNRVPQFSFEVFRQAQGPLVESLPAFAESLRGVAMIPGTGEYALATTPVRYAKGLASGKTANVHTPSGRTDFALSLRQLRGEVPSVRSVSLVVSWFGGDLRCGACDVRPKVEQRETDGKGMPWRAGGIARGAAALVPRVGGKSIYGGTPADAAVIEAIRAIRSGGQEVMFYPFLLMDQLAGNALPDPYGGDAGQPALPWRGRMTLSVAPGRAGSPDRTAAAEAEVAAFFGQAGASQFAVEAGGVIYTGPAGDWGFRRFILHYAKLCVLAGGVDAFCIGSEMRGLTAIRGAGDSFPAVAALRSLAADVRAILGPGTKISYAADWSEYAGLSADGNRYFQLDPLWSDANIDFIGIDNYMPLSDWREGEAQADAAYGSAYDLAYLAANVAGGEGFDWYYDSPEGEAAQRRLPISDDQGEPWVWRVKDLRGWWSNPHHERIDGVRAALPTGWVPQSKPIVFTEYGCGAVDRGTNQPNLFIDPASSESAAPRASRATRDDLAQMQYYRAMSAYWADAANNPLSDIYGAPMVDMAHAHAWAWDARPFPTFPGRGDLWGDGANYARGHWLNGRVTAQPLASVVAEIVGRAGFDAVDLAGLHGLVRGYALGEAASGRAALQPLMLAAGFDAIEAEGGLSFRTRDARVTAWVGADALVADDEGDFEITRGQGDDLAGRLRVGYVEAEADYAAKVAEAALPDAADATALDQEAPLVLLPPEATGVAERWLAEAQVARDGLRLRLPPSMSQIGAGDVLGFAGQRWRIDRVQQGDDLAVEAVRVEAGVYVPSRSDAQGSALASFTPPVEVYPLFLDLPLMKGSEVPHAPHVAAVADPWPGRVAVWVADGEDDFALNTVLAAPSVIGVTETPLLAARAALWDRGEPLRVRIEGGALGAVPALSVLNGANLAAIGDGSSDRWELFQFAEAALVSADTWELSVRLRGQCGTDGLMPEVWPVGSQIVLIDRSLKQIDLPPEARGLARTWRIGAALRGYDDADVVVRSDAFIGAGLRPYPVAHLRLLAQGNDLLVNWVRRTRVDGDSWISSEVPLGEEREAYMVRVFAGGNLLRQVEVAAPQWTYGAAMRAADGAGATVSVAQLSARFGPGPFRSVVAG